VIRNSVFVDCRLDDANFRMAQLSDVQFERCGLTTVDFTAGRLERVTFAGSDCSGADFTKVHCDEVDLRDTRLDGLRGIGSLRGAIVNRAQIVPIALDLALAVGLVVREDPDL
jgi:uncharacterized protein YjbI with pentapeptide repeats